MATTGASLIDTSIFTFLQNKIDQESEVREELKTHVEKLSKEGRLTQSILARIHNVPSSSLQEQVLSQTEHTLRLQFSTLQALATSASKYPYYKWNSLWSRDLQNLISSMQIHEWLRTGQLLSVEQVGHNLVGMCFTKARQRLT